MCHFENSKCNLINVWAIYYCIMYYTMRLLRENMKAVAPKQAFNAEKINFFCRSDAHFMQLRKIGICVQRNSSRVTWLMLRSCQAAHGCQVLDIKYIKIVLSILATFISAWNNYFCQIQDISWKNSFLFYYSSSSVSSIFLGKQPYCWST